MSLMSASSVARQLSMDTVGSELEALAFAALVRSRPAGQSHHRAIVALDIERSTSRPDPVKAEFRTMLYELFDTALRAAGIYPCQRDQFVDRGDGLLALIHEVGQASRALLVHRVVPVLSRFLASYNAGLLPAATPATGPRGRARGKGPTTTPTMFRGGAGCSLPPARRSPSQDGAQDGARPALLSSPVRSTARSWAMATTEPANRPSTASSARRSLVSGIRAGLTHCRRPG